MNSLTLTHLVRQAQALINIYILKTHPTVFSLWSYLLSSILSAIFYSNFVKALFNQFYHGTFISVIRWDSFPWELKGTVWTLIWHIVKNGRAASGDGPDGESSSSRATSHIPHGCSWRTKALASNSRKENPKEGFLFVRHANPPVEIRWQLNEYSWRTQTNERSICKYVRTRLPSDDLAKFQGQPQGKGNLWKKSLRVLGNSQMIQKH